jgi:hypothetical protein
MGLRKKRISAQRKLHGYYLLTYSMKQSPSWESNRFIASQEISRILWNPKAHNAFIIARHLSLYSASPIQSIPPHPTSRRSTLILSSHLRLGLPIGLFPSGFPTKTLYTPLFSPNRPSHSSRFYHPHNIGWGVRIIKLLIICNVN